MYENADWTTSVRSNRFFQQPHVKLERNSWLAICALNDSEPMGNFLDLLIRVAGPMGMHLETPLVYSIYFRLYTVHMEYGWNKNKLIRYIRTYIL